MGKRKKLMSKSANQQYISLSPEIDSVSNAAGLSQCCHLDSANISQIRKIANKRYRDTVGTCEACYRNDVKKRGIAIAASQSKDDVWLCLSCAHQGCGQLTSNQHALKHFNNISGDKPHHLAYSLSGHIVWCFTCESEVFAGNVQPLSNLAQCLNFLKTCLISVKAFPADRSGFAKTALNSKDNLPFPADATPTAVHHGKSAATQRSKNSSKNTKHPDKLSIAKGVKGLSNLGNTCFFNSVMQSLVQTHAFREVLKCNNSEASLRLPVFNGLHQYSSDCKEFVNLSLMSPGPLTSAVQCFFENFTDFDTCSSVVNPSALFGQICKKAPRFRGFAQQDSQELLRYLLEGIRVEEQQRAKSALLKVLQLEDTTSKDSVDQPIQKVLKEYGKLLSATCVDFVFGGSTIGLVRCLECQNMTSVIESFLDLSLSIVDVKALKSHSKQFEKQSAIDEDAAVSDENTKVELKEKISKHQKKKESRNTRKYGKKASLTKDNSTESNNAEDNSMTCKHSTTEANLPLISKEIIVEEQTIASNENGDDLEDFTEAFKCLGLDKPNADIRIDNDCPPVSHNYIDSASDAQCVDEESTSNKYTETKESLEENGSIFTDCHNLTPPLLDAEDELLAWEPLVAVATQRWRSDCSIGSCLMAFTAPELLHGRSAYACANCARLAEDNHNDSACGSNNTDTKTNSSKNVQVRYTKAERRVLIYQPPAVLTLHLKRFNQQRYHLRKNASHVEFSLMLDLAPFCTKLMEKNAAAQACLYSLFAVVVHQGTMNSGHYVAYVKVRPTNNSLVHKFLNHPSVSNLLANCSNGAKQRLIFNDRSCDGGSSEQTAQDSETPAAGTWYHISDTRVSVANESSVLSNQAYLLFYERIR